MTYNDKVFSISFSFIFNESTDFFYINTCSISVFILQNCIVGYSQFVYVYNFRSSEFFGNESCACMLPNTWSSGNNQPKSSFHKLSLTTINSYKDSQG